MIGVGSEKPLVFGPFRLDVASERLWRGADAVPLRPKAFALLNHLVERRGQLVTKEELLDAVWPETFVGDAVLKVTIRQLREALDDDPKAPRFIETQHRRGYRFIGQDADERSPVPPLRTSYFAPGVVGRDGALARMHGWLDRMLGGQRQVVFVTGEAGIGKTALVDTFAGGIVSDLGIRVARGQCLEQYGTGEAYLPFLEAIGRLCRDHTQVFDVLRAHAPMWLQQLPSLVSASEREALGREVLGASRERMLREMGDALETLTADQPLVLILEDLHWSDCSTLDLISYVAKQRHVAQLMLIGTFRTAELHASGNPLKAVTQELLAKQQCEELPLDYLGEDAISEYLAVRFPRNRFPPRLARLIRERTEGNPLFLVNAVDYLVAERLIGEFDDVPALGVEIESVEVGVPDSIRQMIEKQLDHLDPDEQRTLEAASVAGTEFSSLAVVAALGEDRAQVEDRFDELARRHQFIQDCGIHVLPNGEAVSRYGFIHALYCDVLYERVSALQRVRLHRRIGEEGELLFGARAGEIAAELAMHFERGANNRQAVRHLKQAAVNAIHRFAYREAVGLARRGLDLLATLPESAERDEQELCLQLTLGVPLIATVGYASPEVGSVYQRARELCRLIGDTPDISEVLWGLWTFHTLRAELRTAREIAEEFLSLAARLPYPGLAMRSHLAMEITFMHMGEVDSATGHFDKALSLYDPEQHREDAFIYAQHPGVAMRCFGAWALWFLGKPDTALERIHEALRIAHELSEPHGLAHAHFFAAVLHQFRREGLLAEVHAKSALAVSVQHGLVMYEAMATTMLGWALFDHGRLDSSIEHMNQGLSAHQAAGARVLLPHFWALLAEVLGRDGQIDEGLRLLDEALDMTHRNGERYYEAELHRVKGELLLMQSSIRDNARAATGAMVVADAAHTTIGQAERCFQRSIHLARQQQAKSWELRTSTSLARMYMTTGRLDEARTLLARIYGTFTEGFETADLREAKTLLNELS